MTKKKKSELFVVFKQNNLKTKKDVAQHKSVTSFFYFLFDIKNKFC